MDDDLVGFALPWHEYAAGRGPKMFTLFGSLRYYFVEVRGCIMGGVPG